MIRGPFILSALVAAVVLFAAIKTVAGQVVDPLTGQRHLAPPPMVIEPADADSFREIVETTIPPRYNGALIKWYTAILQRQQAKAAAEAKPREDAEQK